MKAIVTGCAGFIGSHLCRRMLSEGWEVHGIDNLDPYYDVRIKEGNIADMKKYENFVFHPLDITSIDKLQNVFMDEINIVIHLAAKAGVRQSFSAPAEYARVNIEGTVNILELCRRYDIDQMVFASSSSVYGNTSKVPYREDDTGIFPVSPYGMTKLQGECFCRLYSELYGIEINALRLFTVYGPGQRPDMAIHKFIRNIIMDKSIDVYGNGETYRDYTYIDDVITGIMSSMKWFKGFCVFNIGSGHPIKLKDLISIISELTGKRAIINRMPLPKGEMFGTWADIEKARSILGYDPKMNFKDGLQKEYLWIKSMLERSIL